MKLSKVRLYYKLLKKRHSIFFFEVLLGALFALNFTVSQEFLLKSVLIFCIFQPFYWALYIINDIFDVEDDRKHPIKKKRVIASGKVSKKEASILALTIIFFSFIFATIISPLFLFLEILFLILNLFYTKVFKHIAYIDSIWNSLTHPLRFILGVLLFNGNVEFYPVIFLFVIALALAYIRRYKELSAHEEGRKSLKRYKLDHIPVFVSLLLVLMFILALSDESQYQNLYLYLSIFGGFFSVNYFGNEKFQNGFNKIFEF
ncbi:hypothetical protein GF362_04290 [Candidatus Dojkabacteria bacterium]|nr:hypothetical protein [Candidatus Dojkabacteria bacterium]